MREPLSRHYTASSIGKLLVSNLKTISPKIVLDMGIGFGSLTKHALDRWKEAEFIGTDIDDSIGYWIQNEFPKVNYFKFDGLASRLPKSVHFGNGLIDVAICNPPYNEKVSIKGFEYLFEQIGLPSLNRFNIVSGDLIFLAQNLRFLRPGGELGIIVPDSIITGLKFQNLRMDLLNNHGIESIIELPDNVFQKTEAKAHILIIKAYSPNTNPICVTSSNENGVCKKVILVEKSDLIQRMDFKFISYKRSLSRNSSQKKLADFDVNIARGNKTKIELEKSGKTFYHTTNILNLDFGSQNIVLSNTTNTVQRGDILLSRVGKRCLGKVAFIDHDFPIEFSDCLYRLRFKDIQDAGVFYNKIKSKHGKEWIDAFSHGTCSKVINKADLLNFLV